MPVGSHVCTEWERFGACNSRGGATCPVGRGCGAFVVPFAVLSGQRERVRNVSLVPKCTKS